MLDITGRLDINESRDQFMTRGGQLKDFWNFQPRTLGKMNPIWWAYFSDGLVQPPTSKLCAMQNYHWNILGGFLKGWQVVFFFSASERNRKTLKRVISNLEIIDIIVCSGYTHTWLKAHCPLSCFWDTVSCRQVDPCISDSWNMICWSFAPKPLQMKNCFFWHWP